MTPVERLRHYGYDVLWASDATDTATVYHPLHNRLYGTLTGESAIEQFICRFGTRPEWDRAYRRTTLNEWKAAWQGRCRNRRAAAVAESESDSIGAMLARNAAVDYDLRAKALARTYKVWAGGKR